MCCVQTGITDVSFRMVFCDVLTCILTPLLSSPKPTTRTDREVDGQRQREKGGIERDTDKDRETDRSTDRQRVTDQQKQTDREPIYYGTKRHD